MPPPTMASAKRATSLIIGDHGYSSQNCPLLPNRQPRRMPPHKFHIDQVGQQAGVIAEQAVVDGGFIGYAPSPANSSTV